MRGGGPSRAWPSGLLGPVLGGGPKEGSDRRPAQEACVAEGASQAWPVGPALQGQDMASSCLTNLARWAPGLWGCGSPCVIQHLEPFLKLKTIWEYEYPCISKISSLKKNKEKGK